jgi:hypothetical protein
MRSLLLALALALAVAGCVTGASPSNLARRASDRPNVVLSERSDEKTMRLAIATPIRADKIEAAATFAATKAEMALEAGRLARAAGHNAFALIEEREFEHGIVRRSLEARAAEPQTFVREWTIELGDRSRPRGDGRRWTTIAP